MIWPSGLTTFIFCPDIWMVKCPTCLEPPMGSSRKNYIGLLGYRVFTSKIVHHQTTHDFIVHDRIHLPTIYLYSVFYPFTIVRHKNMGP